LQVCDQCADKEVTLPGAFEVPSLIGKSGTPIGGSFEVYD